MDGFLFPSSSFYKPQRSGAAWITKESLGKGGHSSCSEFCANLKRKNTPSKFRLRDPYTNLEPHYHFKGFSRLPLSYKICRWSFTWLRIENAEFGIIVFCRINFAEIKTNNRRSLNLLRLEVIHNYTDWFRVCCGNKLFINLVLIQLFMK